MYYVLLIALLPGHTYTKPKQKWLFQITANLIYLVPVAKQILHHNDYIGVMVRYQINTHSQILQIIKYLGPFLLCKQCFGKCTFCMALIAGWIDNILVKKIKTFFLFNLVVVSLARRHCFA